MASGAPLSLLRLPEYKPDPSPSPQPQHLTSPAFPSHPTRLPGIFAFLGSSHQLLLSQRVLTKSSCPERPSVWTAFSRNGCNSVHSSVP